MSKTCDQEINSEITNKSTEFKKKLDILKNEGFTDNLRNIIILKRFNDDCEKAMSHLRANPK